MPQADYFVKPATLGGSDSNNGTTWALAKATVNSALALVNTTTAKTIAVAPGNYDQDISNPGSAGSVSGNHQIIADTKNEYYDSGGNYSGLIGDCVFRRLSQTTASAPYYGCMWNWNTSTCNYWTIDGFFLHGSSSNTTLNIEGGASSAVFTGGKIKNTIMINEYLSGLGGYHWGAGAEITNCAIIGPARASLSVYNTGVLPVSPNITVKGTFFWAGCTATPDKNAALWVRGDTSSEKTYVDLIDCMIVTPVKVYNITHYPIQGGSASYAQIRATRCYLQGYTYPTGVAESYTDCVENIHTPSRTVTGMTTRVGRAGEVYFPPAFVNKHSDLLNRLADYSNLAVYGIDGELLKTAVGGREQYEISSPQYSRFKNNVGVGHISNKPINGFGGGFNG